MKTYITIFLITVICGNIFSQTGRKLSENEKKIFEQKMIEQSNKIKTLQCSFVQEKTSILVVEKAVAKGVMMFQSPSMLRWEYINPTPSILIFNGNDAVLLDKNNNKVGNEKMFKQLGGIIISMINGNGITQNKQFSAEFYEIDNSQMLVILTPIQKRLKDIYNTIELRIDTKTMLANSITLNEKVGDKMVISLTNKVLNSEILKDKFEIK